ncbi:hypothetical protein [Bacillus cereus]|uniref:hypothetical protein n=1 Tax=Bacillus cereus TaxID=1396 RepID=UPI000BF9F5CB|nr:hypothetical protein [Bacillus cereus]PER97010.1 hypothetical protein CN500_11220 [Bacillus cereus]
MFSSEIFFKSIPGIVALASGMITLIGFIFNRIIKVTATNEIDKLFLEKPYQRSLSFWHFNIGALYFSLIYIGGALLFHYNFAEYLNSDVIKAIKYTLVSIVVITTIAFIISLIFLAKYANKKDDPKKIPTIIIVSMIMGLIPYGAAFHQTIYNKTNVSEIIFTLLFPILVFSIYSLSISLSTKKQPKYLVNLVSEAKIKTEQLIHGYVLDETRTIYFSDYYPKDDVFFVCDFNSKVYIKYTKVKTDNENDKINTKSTNQS